MAGDDCSLHHDLEQLTAKQQVDHAENQMLTAALQVALVGLGKPADQVALVDQFLQSPWQALLHHYHQMFNDMGMDPVALTGIHYLPLAEYYPQTALLKSPADLLNLYMVSGSNAVLHKSDAALAISQNVNSKLHFARNAPAAGIPVPETQIFSKAGILRGEADSFFKNHPNGVMVKILGLAGARNVLAVDSRQECDAYIAEYDDALEVLLQEKLDTERYTEMTVDLTVTDTDVTINNIRKILFADGKWVGNYFSSEITPSPAQRDVLLAVGAYARDQGHVQEEGTNCGIDYFIDGDEIIITEINARWTGGLFPAEFLRQLAYQGPAVAFFDTVPVAELEQLRAFQRAVLYEAGTKQDFSMVPIGFSPFPFPVDGDHQVVTWQMVLGDFQAFIQAKNEFFSAQAMPAGSVIAQAQI
ncbi:MAG: hypothetical protein V7742_00775 [Halioglobus sp.]